MSYGRCWQGHSWMSGISHKLALSCTQTSLQQPFPPGSLHHWGNQGQETCILPQLSALCQSAGVSSRPILNSVPLISCVTLGKSFHFWASVCLSVNGANLKVHCSKHYRKCERGWWWGCDDDYSTESSEGSRKKMKVRLGSHLSSRISACTFLHLYPISTHSVEGLERKKESEDRVTL